MSEKMEKELMQARETIKMLQEELAQSSKGMMALTLELEKKAFELVLVNKLLAEDLSKSDSGIMALTLELEGKVVELQHSNRKIQREMDERKKAEDEISQSNVKLEAANKDLESFSYSVSHDLRAPLRAMDGFSRILLEECSDQLDSEGHRYVEIIRSNTKKMATLIDDILDFSRLGRKEISATDIDMNDLARAVSREALAAAPDRKIELNLKDLPPARGDRAMIRQVLFNLVANAVKFTGTREIADVEVGSFDNEGDIVYYVKDNGVGFNMKYADKLYGVFQRLHSSEEFEGTGVGLALVQRIVHKHGGRVWAEAEVGKGAAFYFTIPGGGGRKND